MRVEKREKADEEDDYAKGRGITAKVMTGVGVVAKVMRKAWEWWQKMKGKRRSAHAVVTTAS